MLLEEVIVGKLDCDDFSGCEVIGEEEMVSEVFLLSVFRECVEMDVVLFYFFGYRCGLGVLFVMEVFIGKSVFVVDLLEFFEFDNFYVVEGVIFEV